ncbi:MAG: hypothetical protein KDE22_16455, partial [Rhodobacterales bacterium]|nr:hypothetical protein [Rhodobacterales bacterium]
MPQRPARSLLFGLVLVAGLPFAGENAGAAQVGIAVGPFVSDIRVWDIVTAPPMPPAPPRQVHNDVVLPGNVAHFRLGVRAPGEPFPRLYAIDCDVRPGRRSIVMVMAGRVSM